ncbi:Potassium channel AKT2 [Diplonema papillatum]|nr:Potassium channel AKT2 [Diplonema papillatum]
MPTIEVGTVSQQWKQTEALWKALHWWIGKLCWAHIGSEHTVTFLELAVDFELTTGERLPDVSDRRIQPPTMRKTKTTTAREILPPSEAQSGLCLYFDGGSRQNGTALAVAGAGAVVYEDGKKIAEVIVPLGRTTNNVAEFSALVGGLHLLGEQPPSVQGPVTVRGDSKVVIGTMKKTAQCKPILRPYLLQATASMGALAPRFKFNLEHVARDRNTDADALSNAAMDQVQAQTSGEVIRPDDVQSIVCDLFILIAVLFFFGRVLYEDVRGSTVAGDWTPAKVGFGSVYILDVVRGSFTTITSKDRDTLPVDNRKIVRKAYFRSKRFIIDAVSAIPLDCIFLAVNQDIAVQVCQHLRLVKVLAVPFLFRLSPRDNLSPFYTRFYFSFVPLCHLCFWACTVVHGLSCVWMAIASPRPPSDSATEAEPVQYVDAVYFVVYTLTTTGYGDVDVSTDAEKLFAIALFCCASVVTGLVVGKLVQFSQQADLRTDSYRTMLETLAALDHLTIPPGFKEEVLAFQLHRLKHSNSLFNDAMTGLPKVMQDRMALYARMKIVRQVPIFSSAHEICVAKLAQSLVNVFVPPEEYIVIAGEEGEEMFFLFHGMCAVWLASGKWVATIKRGGIFGEAALLQATRRTASIKSLTYCQLFRLDKDAFTGICEEFPVLYDSIASLSRALQKKVSIRPVGPTKEAAPDASEDEMHSAVLASAPQQSEGVAHTTPPPRCYSFPVTTPLTTKSVWNSDKAGTPRNDPGDAPFGENVSANGDDDDEEEHARKPSVDSTNTSLTSGGTSPSSRRRRAHLASRKGEDAGSPLAYQYAPTTMCPTTRFQEFFSRRKRTQSTKRNENTLPRPCSNSTKGNPPLNFLFSILHPFPRRHLPRRRLDASINHA